MMSAKVQKAVAELLRRTVQAGAWQAAYDYAHNKFSGLELTFAIAELDKARAAHQSASSSEGGSDRPPLTAAEDALKQARESLASARN